MESVPAEDDQHHQDDSVYTSLGDWDWFWDDWDDCMVCAGMTLTYFCQVTSTYEMTLHENINPTNHHSKEASSSQQTSFPQQQAGMSNRYILNGFRPQQSPKLTIVDTNSEKVCIFTIPHRI